MPHRDAIMQRLSHVCYIYFFFLPRGSEAIASCVGVHFLLSGLGGQGSGLAVVLISNLLRFFFCFVRDWGAFL